MAFQITCKECGAVLDCDDSMNGTEITCTQCNKIANPSSGSNSSSQVIAPPPEENRNKIKIRKPANAPVYDPAMFPRPPKPKVSPLAVTLLVLGSIGSLAFLFNLIFLIRNGENFSALFADGQPDAAVVQTATMMFLLLMNTLITLAGSAALFLTASALWKMQQVEHTAATAAVSAEEALFLAKQNQN